MEGQTINCDVIRDDLLLEGFGKGGCGWHSNKMLNRRIRVRKDHVHKVRNLHIQDHHIRVQDHIPILIHILPIHIQARSIQDQCQRRFGGPASSLQLEQPWQQRRWRRERKGPRGLTQDITQVIINFEL